MNKRVKMALAGRLPPIRDQLITAHAIEAHLCEEEQAIGAPDDSIDQIQVG